MPALDGVRAISIMAVVFGHTLPLTFGWLTGNNISARVGMALFFCLSGFLIVSMLHRNQDIFSFLVKRILRIVPALLLYLVILALLFQIPWQMFVSNALFISNYWHEGLSKSIAPTSHLWSLCVEMHFYITIAVLTWLMGKKALFLVPIGALVITGIRIEAGVYSSIITHHRVDEILSGGTLALVAIYYGDPIRRFLTPLWRPTLLLTLLVPLLLASGMDTPLAYLRPYFAAAAVGVVLHCRLAGVHSLLEGRIAAYVAKVSYALYIYHPLAIFGWFNTGSLAEKYLMKRPISYVLAFAMAHASTFFWENRFQKLARQIVKAKRGTGTKGVTAS